MTNISIILTAWNDEPTVRRCLESVIAQENADIQMECIVVDDCSTDGTLAVVRRVVGGYRGKTAFRIFRHQTHHGASRTMNTGLSRAQGEYVLFLRAADVLRPGSIDAYMVALMRYWGTDVIVGNVYNTLLERNLLTSLTSAMAFRGRGDVMCHEMLRSHLYLYAQGKLVRRELLESNHIVFDENLAYADVLWAFSLFACSSSLVLLPDVTYEYGRRQTGPIGQREKWANALLSSYTATCDALLDRAPRPESSDSGYYQAHQLFVYGVLNSALNVQKEYAVNNQVQREIINVRNRLFAKTKNDGQRLLYLFFRQDDSIFSGLFKKPAFGSYSRVAGEVAAMMEVVFG